MDKRDFAQLLVPLYLKADLEEDVAIQKAFDTASRFEEYDKALAVPNQLTTNFTLDEFKRVSQTGWNVFVNLDAQHAAQVLQKARDQLKLSVTILSFSKTSTALIVEVNSGNNTQLNTILNSLKISNVLHTKSITITLPL